MILQKIKKSIEKIGIPCFLDYNDATSYCAVLIPETNGKESIKVDIQFIWEDGNPILLADEWIKSLRMNKELKAIVLGSENNYAGFVLRVKVIDVSICSYIPTGNRYTITIVNDTTKGSVSGAGKYLEGKTCTLTAYPNEQYYFVGWLTPDDDVVHENPYSFTVEGDATYESYFLSKYHVEVESAGNGTVSGSGYYEPTESCTITATPNTEYHFVNWTVSGLELTTSNPYTFIPTGDITITANFAINTYTISASGTNGTVSGDGSYNYGTTCTLTATPNTGYEFTSWTENGNVVSTNSSYSFTVEGNRTLVANFTAIDYTVSVSSSGNGSVSGGGTYHYGDTVNLSATPDQGYSFSDWTEGGSTVSSSNPYSFTCTGDITITANFSINTYTISTSGTGGTITGSGTYNYGATCTLTATPNTGYEFVSWTEDGETISTLNPYSFTVDSDRTITAVFNQINYTVSATSSGNGSVSGGGTYHYGDSITLTATPNGGYIFVNWTENDVEVSTYNPYTFSCTGNQTIVGNFEEFSAPLIINCSAPSSVILTNSSNQTYELSLVEGENVYEGTEPGFALDEITGLKRGSNSATYYNLITIDATGLTSWTSIEDGAFRGENYKSNLESITLPDSITSIGQNAFYYCNSLTSITLSDSITNIGYRAFADCTGLAYITCLATTPPTISNSFDYTNDCPIYVPVGYVDTYKTAWSSYASRIVGDTPAPSEDYLEVDCKGNTSVILTNSSNQTYTWNLSIGRNYYTGTEPGFAINEITDLKKGNNSETNIISINASKLTSWTTITSNAFNNCQSLVSIILPEGLTTMNGASFGSCKFSSIVLPNSLTTIYDGAFANCQKLTSLNIPAGVSSIPGRLGYGFSNLTSLTVDSNNQYYNDGNGGNCVVETSTNILRQGCNTTIIPNTVVELGNGAFYSCTGLTSITLPDSLITVGSNAFSNCYNLTSLDIPASVSSIGNGAFSNCSGLTSITVNSNNQYYNDGNGSNCIIETATNKLIRGCNITIIPNTVVELGDSAFEGCTFTSITLPNTLTKIGQTVFQNCQKLVSIIVPSSVNYIGHCAFWGTYCLYIEFEGTTPATLGTNSIFSSSFPLYVPSSAVSAYQTAWSTYASRITAKPEPTGSDYLRVDCDDSTSVILTNSSSQTYTLSLSAGINYYNGDEPGFAINEITGLKKSESANTQNSKLVSIDASKLTSWTTMSNYAFNKCSRLNSVVLPNSLTSIGQYAFNNCQSLTSITLSNSLTTISDMAFYQCSGLTSLTLPDSITSIGGAVFCWCSSLESVNIPTSLITLGYQAFASCYNLTSPLVFPATLTLFGNSSVNNCTSLTSITCLATTPPTLNNNDVFTGTPLTAIYVPSASVSAYQSADKWSRYANIIQAIPTP